MKKLLLTTAFVLGCASMNAQGNLTLSTYKGTDIAKYAGKTLNVTVNRYVFSGWNTIALPFSLTEAQVDEVFGKDCRLEKLVGVENDGQGIRLNFQDCKAEGIRANTPYILYYAGATGTKKIKAENVLIADAPAKLAFTAEGTGETVTMSCAKQQVQTSGLYGIKAKDNHEAAFVNADDASNGFYATRCYIQLSNGNYTTLTTNHLSGDITSIASVAKNSEKIDVYNVSGVKVASQISASEVNTLQKGIYVVKGKKVLVK